MKKNIWYCIFDDETALANRNVIGIDRLTFEVDYPHADSTFPHTKDIAERMAAKAGLNDVEIQKFFRGNAIELYKLDKYYGITK
jgi:hypothetical protein